MPIRCRIPTKQPRPARRLSATPEASNVTLLPRRSRLAIVALVVVSLCAGCGTEAPSGEASAAPIAGPVATATRDGLVVTRVVERAALTAGQRVWARVTVANGAPVVRHYQGGGCDFLASLQVRTAAAVAPAPGRQWDGAAGFFKTLVWMPGPAESIAFIQDERFVDRGGVVACPADLGVNDIKPGERLEMKAAWDGEVSGVVATAGPARVTASFPYLGQGGEGDLLGRPPQPIEAAIDVDVVDGGVRLRSPGEAIDAALSNPGFAAWVTGEPKERWQGVSLEARGHTLDVILDSGIDRGVAAVARATGAEAFSKRPRP
jgi:hypothetical protein